jgi:hypothetical protein
MLRDEKNDTRHSREEEADDGSTYTNFIRRAANITMSNNTTPARQRSILLSP